MRILSMVFIMLCCGMLLKGQSIHQLTIVPTDTTLDFLQKEINLPKTPSDSAGIHPYLTNILTQLHEKAYLTASIDSLIQQDTNWVAFIHLGRQYHWATLANGNIDPAFVEQVRYRASWYEDRLFAYHEVLTLQRRLLNYAENNGHPFAKVWLDSIYIDGDRIHAQIFMEKNELIKLKDIELETEVRISTNYLTNYLGLKAEDLYDESKLSKVRQRINRLAFLTEKRPLSVTFVEDKATIHLFLENKKASRFDFLIGFLPGSGPSNRLLLTGNAELDLQNPFGTGKRLHLHWEQLRPETPRLETHFSYPYILGLPFGADIHFNLYKRDSTYLDVESDVGLQYYFEGGNYLKAFWNTFRTNLLTLDETRILQSRQLPTQLDMTIASFGLEYRFEHLDNRFAPRKGTDVLLRVGTGTRQIRRNPRIEGLQLADEPAFEFGALYDSLQLRTFQFKATLSLAQYFPIGKRSTIKTALNGGWVQAGEQVYLNELYRLGGNRLLRGFDEESIFASGFGLATVEYRFFIGAQSWLYAFGDYALIYNSTTTPTTIDLPLGFGIGLTFETGAGIFGLSYALGRQAGNPIDLSAGKIHFGYINYF